MADTPAPSRLMFFWDFHGPDAEATARHFASHLLEFFERNELALQAEATVIGEGHCAVRSEMPDIPAAVLRQLGFEGADEAKPTVAERVGKALRPQRMEPVEPGTGR